jgi:hypothetical protein
VDVKTVLAPWAYAASVLYHDTFWYPTHPRVVREVLRSDWGRLFNNWERLAIPPGDLDSPGWDDVGESPAELRRESLKLVLKSMRILGTCLREAPEFAARRRRRVQGSNLFSSLPDFFNKVCGVNSFFFILPISSTSYRSAPSSASVSPPVAQFLRYCLTAL